MKELTIIIPAAGASSRMRGRDKLLEEVDGTPLLRRQVMRALKTGLPVIVTLPVGHEGRIAALDGLEVTTLGVPDAAHGMTASLRAGAAAADRDHALMILLPDMPDITSDDLSKLTKHWRATPDRILRATSETGVPGHPVILPARLRPLMADLTGDQGAKPLISREEVVTIPLPGTRAITDLDTPEAWAAWRAQAR